jgi:tRNA threonylcarbamoyladenosine biosynthesis protein TsaB
VKLLALETATLTGSVAIMDGESLVAESRITMRVTHSERIMSEIEHVLRRSSLKLEEIDAFGISIGPGSFTGLRVGLSTVKGLAYATGKTLVSIPTLEALAWNIPFALHDVCPMLDARKKEVYAGIFRWEGAGFQRVMVERSVSIGTLLRQISECTIFLGDGALLYREIIAERLAEKAVFGYPQQMIPSAATVAFLCIRKAIRGEFENPEIIRPCYLKRSEAELKTVVR